MRLEDQFVNGIEKMNSIAHSLVNGNAKLWATKAERKGIISSFDKDVIFKLVGIRVFIAHGGAGRVQIAEEEVNEVNKYIRIMNSTSEKFKEKTKIILPPGTFRSFIKELTFNTTSNTYYFKFEIVEEYQKRSYDDGTRFSGTGYTIYVINAPYKEWCLEHDLRYKFHFYSAPRGSESICWNSLITNFADANAVMLVWAKRYVKILEKILNDKSINISNYDASQKRKYNMPSGTFRKKQMTFSKSVLNQIKETIGKMLPEQGGFLGISNCDDVVDYFVHDINAKVGYSEYNPNVEFINKVINEEWANKNIDFCGFIHSHPSPSNMLSRADIEYALRIMKEFGLSYLYMPLVNSSIDGRFHIYGYFVYRNGKVEKSDPKFIDYNNIKIEPIDILKDEEKILDIFDSLSMQPVEKEETNSQYTRIQNTIPLDYLKKCTIIGIGCGGAREFYIDMARMGIGNFYLVDGDKVSLTNIASQNVYMDELNRLKVDAIKDKIMAINDKINVTTFPFMLEDNLDDKWIEENIIKSANHKEILLCAFTDDFYAQARITNIAKKYKIPLISAQHHKFGETSEIIFWYPNITKITPEMILKDRYDAYRRGFVNNVTSEGSLIFNTVRLNSLCEKIGLGLLLFNHNNYNLFSSFLIDMPSSNLLLIRQCSLLQSDSPFKNLFNNNETSYFDDVLWINPEKLFELKVPDEDKKIEDTRVIF